MSSLPDQLRESKLTEVGEILIQGVDRIVEQWTIDIHLSRPSINSTHREDLRDHLPDFIRALGESLRCGKQESQRHHKAIALHHGEQRWKLGWELADLVADYQLLRVAILRHVYEALPRRVSYSELLVANLYIDDAISAATVSYVEHQRVELEQAHQRLSEFLSVLGHELRNPLHTFSMGLELLDGNGKGKDHETKALMKHQTTMMNRLLTDMLDVTQITRGRLALEKQAVDLVDALRRAIDATRSAVVGRDHQLVTELPGEPVMVEADPHRVEQIVVNLIGNACKYTERGGTIRLSLCCENDQEAVLRVGDNGKGIGPDLLPHLFDLFVQGREDSGRGLGIGLALSRMLVELHGGRIEASSPGVGRGSDFIVRLPLLVQAEPAKYDGEARRESAAGPYLRRHRILIVDDAEDGAGMLVKLLQQRGHEVSLALDGETALQIAEAEQPEVILLDVGLPGMSGYDVARRLRESARFEHALIITMTGFADEHRREKSGEAGVDYHLVKPVELDSIQRLMVTHFRNVP